MGQATVEAAFLIPVIFVVLLMLIQPAILLYDRMVMSGAAAEGCRMLITRSASSGLSDDEYREAVKRHLGSIPQQENFHVHEGGCSWNIELAGDETSSQATVAIRTKVHLLPLFDFGSVLLGVADEDGNIEISVSVTEPTQNTWVADSELGLSPKAWVEKWA